MAWYVIDMPEESVTDGGYHRLCRQFQKAFIGAGAPPEMALFACRNGVVEGRRLYLTPSSTMYIPDLIRYYGAEPCGTPEANHVTLVYGVPNAKTLLTTVDESDLSRKSTLLQRATSTTGLDLGRAKKKPDAPAIYPLSRSRQAVSNG